MNRLRSRHLPIAVDRALSAVQASDLDTRTDADLLDRFARYGEQPAFEVLLRRHGPVIYGVCRRMLLNTADAEDAFQATFLVLVRRARTVRGERLGPWLYGVAVRVSLKARTRAARVAARQTEATDMIPDPTPPAEPTDWLPVLDAELAAIPAKYREPMVLCELQGLTRAVAAATLGIPEGTLSSRLARGRELLRQRLLRHGTLLPAGGLTALLAGSGVGKSAVPAGLFTRTAELVAGADAAGVVPAGPARLTDEVVKDMFLTKLRTASGAALAVGVLAAGLVAAFPTSAPGQPETTKPQRVASQTPPVVPASATKPTLTPPADPTATTKREVVPGLQGLWKLEKCDFPPKALGNAEAEKELALMVKYTWLLVDGDIWWLVMGNHATRHVVTLDPSRNPKWIDAPTHKLGNVIQSGLKGIYRQPDVDTLEFCTSESDPQVRPAEFATDDDLGVFIFRFKRVEMPAIPAELQPAREKLHGLWLGIGVPPAGGNEPPREVRIEFTTHFAFVADGPQWAAYAYHLDTEKNPCWIDLMPVTRDLPKDAPTQKPLLGSYQLNQDGTLKMVLGDGVKRIARPLEFVSNPKANIRVLDLVRGNRESTGTSPQQTPVPNPKPAGAAPAPVVVPKDAKPPLVLPAPGLQPTFSPPGGRNAFGRVATQVTHLFSEGDFAKAEVLLREQLKAAPDGADATVLRLLLGVCLLQQAGLQRAGESPVDPATDARRREALALFQQVVAGAEEQSGGGKYDDWAEWLRTQAGLRICHTYLLMGQPDKVEKAAALVIARHPGTVDELIALSLVYHAQRQERPDEAARTRERMQKLFEQLRNKPGAFREAPIEYSLAYWEKVWFPMTVVTP